MEILRISDRLDTLAEQTRLLRSRASQLMDDDETLWMSSLDIIDELLDTVQGLIRQTGGDPGNPAESVLHCPNCHALVKLPFEAVAQAATVCPRCGADILLTNPT